jgi:hypothetical protein
MVACTGTEVTPTFVPNRRITSIGWSERRSRLYQTGGDDRGQLGGFAAHDGNVTGMI